ncbi:F-box protein At3g07870-like [Corylus avellana]|uniref:F-box protein At3g07870-like n=1 Tax=Corylus avellana TaxID=13451 RepID=UPI00286C67A5|nr:F-box protein At3g07870-like [Corylus avellana]
MRSCHNHQLSSTIETNQPTTFLPEDVVLKILSRLPPKSLLRFRSVCKSWLSLIGTPNYVSKNLLNHSILTTAAAPHHLLLVKRTTASIPRTDTCSFLSYQTLSSASQTPQNIPIRSTRGLSIVGSCNGLLCLFDYFAGGDIFVWNPATSELKALPGASRADTVSFGFDHKRNEFKVMRIRYVMDREPPVLSLNRVADVYSLRSGGSWRNLTVDGEVPDSNTPNSRCRWAYAYGVCFWWTSRRAEDEKIIAFDVSEEVFRTTPLPDASVLGRRSYVRALTVLNESVAMLVVRNESKWEGKSFDLWVLLEFGVKESWTQLLRIEAFPGLEWPLGFWKNGELFMENHEGQLVYYDPFTNTVTKVEVGDNDIDRVKESLQVLAYTPTSHSIHGGRDYAFIVDNNNNNW